MRPTELLRQEHCTIDALLDRLEWTAIGFFRTGSLDIALARRLVLALTVFLDRWHRQKEEELLLPLVQERGVSKRVISAALMQQEHESGHEALGAMAEALGSIVGTNWSTHSRLCCTAIAFVDGMRRHMRREEEVVFPLAEVSLRDEDRRALVLAFDRVEKQDPAPGTRDEIHRLVGIESPRESSREEATSGTSKESVQDVRGSTGVVGSCWRREEVSTGDPHQRDGRLDRHELTLVPPCG